MIYKTITVATLSVLVLSACSTSKTEARALKAGGIADARGASKELHLAYLDCYALPEVDKLRCHRLAREKTDNRHDAASWDYVLPYDYEAERLGFVAFLRDRNQQCAGLDEGVQFNQEYNAYVVNCTDGNSYTMRFDREREQWSHVFIK